MRQGIMRAMDASQHTDAATSLPPPPEFLICAGDVLLLRSAGRGGQALARQGNLAAQGLLRLGRYPASPAHHTHVAVVINAQQIADAMPRHGVRLRDWASVAADYDIERSLVLRHHGLSRDPQATARVFRAYTRLHRQPYRLLRALRASRTIGRDQGTVCSGFASDLLALLRVPAPRPGLTAVLPADLERFTRRHPAWQRFALHDHGLAAPFDDLRRGLPPRHVLDEAAAYVEAQMDAVLPGQAESAKQEGRQRGQALAAGLRSALEADDLSEAGALLAPMLAAAAQTRDEAQALSHAVFNRNEPHADRVQRIEALLELAQAQLIRHAAITLQLLQAMRDAQPPPGDDTGA